MGKLLAKKFLSWLNVNGCCYEREPTLTLLFPLNFGLLSCKAQCLRKKTGVRKYLVKEI